MSLLSTAFIIQYLAVELRDLCSMVLMVKLQGIVDEMDTLSDELHAYLNKQTGELVTISSEALQAVEEEDAIESYP